MEITIATAVVIALITALVQVGKGLGLKSQHAPLAAIALGVLYFFGTADVSVISAINGIASGLLAVGLYSVGGKTAFKALSGK